MYFAIAFLVLGLATIQAWDIGQTVSTSSGNIQGHPDSSAPNVSEYLGIPFAVPPVGSLRFTPPQPYLGNETINASS